MSDDSAPPPIALANFENALRELLSVLDDPKADVLAIERKNARVSRALDELRSAGVDSLAENSQLRHSFARARSLHAVARQLVGTRLEVIEAGLARLRTARRALGRVDDNAGESCDVDG